MKKMFVILVLAALLRLWNLGSFPALNADEAALGYNAYSLIETGRDEHGNSWPIHFQSFNDYKPGGYVYSILPFVKLFGLTEWSVRLPSVLLAIATVYLIYLLGKKLFDEKTGLFAGLLLAISPWHIHFSRGGWEVNVATFFITLGVLFLIDGLENPKKYLVAALSFIASLYVYHSSRVVVPLLLLGFALLFWKKIRKNLRGVLIACLLSLLLLFPLGIDLFSGGTLSRAAGVGLFADSGIVARINEQRGEHVGSSNMLAKLLHNKVVNVGLEYAENWFDHFSGGFLFVRGDGIERDMVPEVGQLYLFEIFTISIGIFTLVKGWRSGKLKNKISAKVITLWIVVAPAASAFAFQSPSALRSHNIVVPLVLVSAVGLSKLVSYVITAPRFRLAGLTAITAAILLSFVRYEIMYWGHMAKQFPFSSQYGVKQLASYIQENNDKYENVVITTRYDQPYVLLLFYMKYSPGKFQNDHILTARDKFGFSTVPEFDKYVFAPINYTEMASAYPRSLIVGTDEEIPDSTNIIKEIKQNDFLYFQAVAN